MKSSYNEQFLFPDPLSKTSACRKTRYRAKLSKAKTVPGHTECNHDRAHISKNASQLQYENAMEIISDTHSDDNMMLETDNEKFLSHMHIDALTSLESNVMDLDVECDELDNPHSLEFDLMVATAEFPESEEDDKDNELTTECEPSYSNLHDQQELLYKEASITTAASSVLMMKYAMKHKLSWEALADLLQIVKLHCPFPNNVPSTLFHFKKHFKDLQYPTQHHYFCSTCLSEVSENAKVCGNRECSCSFNESNSFSSFIEVPVD